jgi:Gluconate 2-dehydrogenase subunit 3
MNSSAAISDEVSVMLNRREALARMAAITGASLIGAEFFLSGCARTDKFRFEQFTPQDIALLDEVGDTIIPATDTPGAKATGIGAFMAMIVNDCYNDETHGVFYQGLAKIEKASQQKHDRAFAALSSAERHALLSEIDQEQQQYYRERKRSDPHHYFRLMKDLTVLGFFSSEIGCTQAMRYAEAPGAYHGDVPYVKGERAWFNPTRRVG